MTAVAPIRPSTDPSFQGIHHPAGQAVDRLLPGGEIPQFCLEGWLQHSDLQDADAAAGASEASSKESREATEGLAQLFIDAVQGSIDGWDQS